MYLGRVKKEKGGGNESWGETHFLARAANFDFFDFKLLCYYELQQKNAVKNRT